MFAQRSVSASHARFQHAHRPLARGESIPAMPSMFEQLRALSGATLKLEAELDSDWMYDDIDDELYDDEECDDALDNDRPRPR